jgi:hypothetical protein
MDTYPHKIENGEGEVLTFFGVVRHRDGDRMEVEPAVVQKVAFPVLLAAGTLLGKYDKFKDAPEPVLETQAGSPHSTRAV